MRARILRTRRLRLTIGEELRRDRERRTFFHRLGKLIGLLILLAFIWLDKLP
jgi:hypothetical protein